MNFNGSHRFNRSLKIHIYIDVRRKYIEVDIYTYQDKTYKRYKVKLVFKKQIKRKEILHTVVSNFLHIYIHIY